MNALVLSDNPEVLQNLKPIFEKRKLNRWTFTDSDAINPKKDFKHIIDNYDIVFSAHCRNIFPKILTDSVRCINIHPGYNPHNRGMFPHVFSIVNGLPAGVTVHQMDEGIDSGKYYMRWRIPVRADHTSTSLYHELIEMEKHVLDWVLDNILDGSLEPIEYNDPGNYNSMEDFKRLCNIDPDKVGTFKEFFDISRALSHAGYLNANMNGIKFKLIIG